MTASTSTEVGGIVPDEIGAVPCRFSLMAYHASWSQLLPGKTTDADFHCGDNFSLTTGSGTPLLRRDQFPGFEQMGSQFLVPDMTEFNTDPATDADIRRLEESIRSRADQCCLKARRKAGIHTAIRPSLW